MTKTKQLREKMAKALREHYLGDCPGMPTWEDCKVKEIWRAKADAALKICQEADLVFVVKDAELPPLSQQRRTHIDETWFRGTEKIASAYREAQQDMLKACFKQTEEIKIGK